MTSHSARLIGLVASLPFLIVVSLVFVAAAIFDEILLCRIGCAIIAASWTNTSWRVVHMDLALDPASPTRYRDQLIRQRDAFRSFVLWGQSSRGSGRGAGDAGLLAEHSRWFDATMAAGFWFGLQIAFWASYSRRAEALEREITLLEA